MESEVIIIFIAVAIVVYFIVLLSNKIVKIADEKPSAVFDVNGEYALTKRKWLTYVILAILSLIVVGSLFIGVGCLYYGLRNGISGIVYGIAFLILLNHLSNKRREKIVVSISGIKHITYAGVLGRSVTTKEFDWKEIQDVNFDFTGSQPTHRSYRLRCRFIIIGYGTNRKMLDLEIKSFDINKTFFDALNFYYDQSVRMTDENFPTCKIVNYNLYMGIFNDYRTDRVFKLLFIASVVLMNVILLVYLACLH